MVVVLGGTVDECCAARKSVEACVLGERGILIPPERAVRINKIDLNNLCVLWAPSISYLFLPVCCFD
jgi:hypothetical protein